MLKSLLDVSIRGIALGDWLEDLRGFLDFYNVSFNSITLCDLRTYDFVVGMFGHWLKLASYIVFQRINVASTFEYKCKVAHVLLSIQFALPFNHFSLNFGPFVRFFE